MDPALKDHIIDLSKGTFIYRPRIWSPHYKESPTNIVNIVYDLPFHLAFLGDHSVLCEVWVVGEGQTGAQSHGFLVGVGGNLHFF